MRAIKWTKDYHGCRKGLQWKLTEKVRGPAEALTSTFGAEVEKDVITLVSIAPTPFERGSERYDTTYEIVSLGRNKKVAEKRLDKLKDEARAEKALQEFVKRNMDNEIMELLESQQRSLDNGRKNAVELLGQIGLEALFTNGDFDDLVGAEVIAPYVKITLQSITDMRSAELHKTPDYIPPKEGIVRSRARKLQSQLAKRLLSADMNLELYGRRNRFVDVLRVQQFKSIAEFHSELTTAFENCEHHDKLTSDLERRYALRRRPVDEQIAEAVAAPVAVKAPEPTPTSPGS